MHFSNCKSRATLDHPIATYLSRVVLGVREMLRAQRGLLREQKHQINKQLFVKYVYRVLGSGGCI